MKKILCILSACTLLFSGCSIKKDIAMKVGDVDVKTEYVEYFEKSMNNQSSGTVTDEVKAAAAKQAEELAKYIAIGHAENLDITDKYNQYIESLKSQLGDDFDKFKKEHNISDDLFDFINYASVYNQALRENCEKENNINEQSADDYFKSHFWRAKHLLLMTKDDSGKSVSDDKKKEIKAKIDDLYKQAKNGADFDKLIQEYNQDPGVKSNPDGYVFTDGEMVPEFQNGVSSINVGEYNLVETSYGYHIVKRLALDETPELYKKFKEENTSKISNAIVGDVFDKYIDDKMDSLKITVKDYTGSVEKSTESASK